MQFCTIFIVILSLWRSVQAAPTQLSQAPISTLGLLTTSPTTFDPDEQPPPYSLNPPGLQPTPNNQESYGRGTFRRFGEQLRTALRRTPRPGQQPQRSSNDPLGSYPVTPEQEQPQLPYVYGRPTSSSGSTTSSSSSTSSFESLPRSRRSGQARERWERRQQEERLRSAGAGPSSTPGHTRQKSLEDHWERVGHSLTEERRAQILLEQKQWFHSRGSRKVSFKPSSGESPEEHWKQVGLQLGEQGRAALLAEQLSSTFLSGNQKLSVYPKADESPNAHWQRVGRELGVDTRAMLLTQLFVPYDDPGVDEAYRYSVNENPEAHWLRVGRELGEKRKTALVLVADWQRWKHPA